MRVLNCKPKILNKKNSNVRFRKINIHSHKIYISIKNALINSVEGGFHYIDLGPKIALFSYINNFCYKAF